MICLGCGKVFVPKRPQQRYHNAPCLRAAAKRAKRAQIEARKK